MYLECIFGGVKQFLGGGFIFLIFHPYLGEDFQFD